MYTLINSRLSQRGVDMRRSPRPYDSLGIPNESERSWLESIEMNGSIQTDERKWLIMS